MADRQVKVSLVAQVNGYISGMQQAARSTQEVGTAAAKLAQQRQAFEALGRSALIMGAVVAAGVAVAIRKFAEFDQAMSNVSAVTQETAANMDLLRDAALDAGGRTVFTATEAANAIEELGKAGISTADILSGALDGALALAASGQLEVARAAEITATTLKQFGLDGSEAGHVADVLSAGAGKALGSVEDLANGLKFVGPVAASMGISLEETTGALALFADQGLIGEQAGTSLRGVLSSLTSPSKEAAKEIEHLGINLYDSQGGFVSLENLAGQLSNAYSGLDDKTRDASLGILFGNQQVTAARVLFDGGATAVHKYTAEVNDAGYAARVAADRMNNLNGDLEKLGGAFDTALIKTGSGANDVLRGLVQSATFLVDAFGNLPQPVLNASLAVGAVAAAIALAGGTALVAVPKIAAFKSQMDDLGLSARKVAVGVGLVGTAVGVATLILGAFIQEQAASAGRVDSFKESLDQATGAVTKYTRELVVKKLEEKGAFDDAARFGIGQKELTDAVLNGGGALDYVTRKLDSYGDSLTGNQKRAADLSAANSTTAITIRTTRGELEQASKALENSKAATDDNTAALEAMQGQAQSTGREIDGLADTIRGFGSATLDVRDAQRKFQAAIDDAQASLEENGATLDVNTEAGRANEAALDDIATSALDAAAAIYDKTKSEDEATAAVQAGRDALIDQLAQYDITGDAAAAYADSLGLIPENIDTLVTLDTDPADAALQAFINRWNGASVNLTGVGSPGLGSGVLGQFATGGYTGDMPASAIAGYVHGREFVANEKATAIPANRAALEFMNSGGDMSRYQPTYQSAPAALPYMVAPSDSGRTTKVELNAHGVDPQTVTDMLLQRIGTGLVRL